MSEIFENPEIEVIEVKKKKRKLTQKQLDNLALGREKMKIKRELLKKERELLKQEKVEKKEVIKADKESVKIKKEIKKDNKKKKKVNLKVQAEAIRHREKLILQREKKLAEAEAEAEEKKQREKQAHKFSRFEDLRSKWLTQTTSVEQFDIVSTELDSIPEEVISNDEKLEETLYDLMIKYKGVED